ncbi:MAG TPA: biosynthetic peptidoglycan transglycosylase, partial [Ktedonobacteraceae bacterium]|nr:biosynthetic peptidoglycan transglycosylase [Ktedonobacteraceae bacterium]
MDNHNDRQHDRNEIQPGSEDGSYQAQSPSVGSNWPIQPFLSGKLTAAPAPSQVASDPQTQQKPRRNHRSRANRFMLHKRQERRTNKRRGAGKGLGKTLFIIAAVIFALFSGTMGGAFAYYQAQLPLLTGIANHTTFQTTRIYDRNNQLLYQINDPKYGRRTYVNYTDISEVLVNATVAAEDHTFWTNSGVDIQGILRAASANVQSNGIVEGASTITQQLIKRQLFVDAPRNFQIKAEEALLSFGITQQLPKWKIMEMYLNVIYYGELNYGAEAAAQDFFGIKPKCTKTHCIPAVGQLDLAQASL